jgi:hypothetical protein
MMVLWNPTNETIEPVFHGITYTFKPGEKQKVEDACGKHILNAYTQRGMTVLEYGDEKREQEIGEKARRRNREFKIKQVETYNQTNESRKMQGQSYLTPPDKVREYADELGIELNAPYLVRDKDREEMDRMVKENDGLRNLLASMNDRMAKMEEALNKNKGR